MAYGRATFALKDLERVSNCAYFDYQRERVFVRTDKKVAKLVKRAKKKPPAPKPNQVIELTCEKCVLCGSPEIKAGRKVRQRRLTDLRFSASGVKRWVILYRADGTRVPRVAGIFCLKGGRSTKATSATNSQRGACTRTSCAARRCGRW